MDLSQYKMIRSNKFPLQKASQDNKNNKPDFVKTIALVSAQEPETY